GPVFCDLRPWTCPARSGMCACAWTLGLPRQLRRTLSPGWWLSGEPASQAQASSTTGHWTLPWAHPSNLPVPLCPGDKPAHPELSPQGMLLQQASSMLSPFPGSPPLVQRRKLHHGLAQHGSPPWHSSPGQAAPAGRWRWAWCPLSHSYHLHREGARTLDHRRAAAQGQCPVAYRLYPRTQQADAPTYRRTPSNYNSQYASGPLSRDLLKSANRQPAPPARPGLQPPGCTGADLASSFQIGQSTTRAEFKSADLSPPDRPTSACRSSPRPEPERPCEPPGRAQHGRARRGRCVGRGRVLWAAPPAPTPALWAAACPVPKGPARGLNSGSSLVTAAGRGASSLRVASPPPSPRLLLQVPGPTCLHLELRPVPSPPVAEGSPWSPAPSAPRGFALSPAPLSSPLTTLNYPNLPQCVLGPAYLQLHPNAPTLLQALAHLTCAPALHLGYVCAVTASCGRPAPSQLASCRTWGEVRAPGWARQPPGPGRTCVSVSCGLSGLFLERTWYFVAGSPPPCWPVSRLPFMWGSHSQRTQAPNGREPEVTRLQTPPPANWPRTARGWRNNLQLGFLLAPDPRIPVSLISVPEPPTWLWQPPGPVSGFRCVLESHPASTSCLLCLRQRAAPSLAVAACRRRWLRSRHWRSAVHLLWHRPCQRAGAARGCAPVRVLDPGAARSFSDFLVSDSPLGTRRPNLSPCKNSHSASRSPPSCPTKPAPVWLRERQFHSAQGGPARAEPQGPACGHPAASSPPRILVLQDFRSFAVLGISPRKAGGAAGRRCIPPSAEDCWRQRCWQSGCCRRTSRPLPHASPVGPLVRLCLLAALRGGLFGSAWRVFGSSRPWACVGREGGTRGRAAPAAAADARSAPHGHSLCPGPWLAVGVWDSRMLAVLEKLGLGGRALLGLGGPRASGGSSGRAQGAHLLLELRRWRMRGLAGGMPDPGRSCRQQLVCPGPGGSGGRGADPEREPQAWTLRRRAHSGAADQRLRLFVEDVGKTEGPEMCWLVLRSPRGEAAQGLGAAEAHVLLLADEKFDFDLSLSSSSANEDDEVFFGPVGHKERCVAASLELNRPVPKEPLPLASEGHCAWSPLTGEKFVEVYKEAHLLALQIESSSRAPAARPEAPQSQGVERFIQESQAKIRLFERENWAKKSPQTLKRETYCLAEPPLHGPPPTGAQRPTQVPPHPCHPLLPGPRPAPPPDQAGAQKRAASKLPPPRTSGARRGPPGLAAGKPTGDAPASPSQAKLPDEKDPHRDGPSVARAVTGRPAVDSHGAPSKRSLPVPHKVGLRHGAAGAAPTPGDPPGLPAGGPPPPCDPGRPGRSTPAPVPLSVPAGPAGGPSQQSRGPRAAGPAPSMAAPTQPRTPAQGGAGPHARPGVTQSSRLSETGSVRRRGSSLHSETKGEPTPVNPFKIPRCSTGEPPAVATPQPPRAPRPQPCTPVGRLALHSTPARCASTPAPQSCPRGARTPASTRRLSALPTPAGRRLSSLPLAAPRTMPRALASPLRVSARRLSSEARKRSSVRAAPSGEGGGQAAPGCPDSSPEGSFSPPSTVPQALNFSPEKNDSPFSPSVPTQVALGETRPPSDTSPREAVLVDLKLDELTITPTVESTPLVDLPLIDFGNTPEAKVALGQESRPLIDLLVNTPDLNRGAAPKPVHEAVQLIDLTSPLIQLSPKADKENVDSPLLRF
ncbi:G2 and S phase-expressed protein 1, partial [Galemys pyrenaicus]